jgi:hypothetical protein
MFAAIGAKFAAFQLFRARFFPRGAVIAAFALGTF